MSAAPELHVVDDKDVKPDFRFPRIASPPDPTEEDRRERRSQRRALQSLSRFSNKQLIRVLIDARS